MSELRIIAEDYVAMRRALGFKFGIKAACSCSSWSTSIAATWRR